ncbi:MAG: hypothetical protein H6621_10130 [Halobacteriovoraceae bacterium]|nr:hypothetical protein [Halobacteriovoraceae bacterium]MCB9095414.1 hypothetical protein [Halobacteriovoraceae bacterium]
MNRLFSFFIFLCLIFSLSGSAQDFQDLTSYYQQLREAGASSQEIQQISRSLELNSRYLYFVSQNVEKIVSEEIDLDTDNEAFKKYFENVMAMVLEDIVADPKIDKKKIVTKISSKIGWDKLKNVHRDFSNVFRKYLRKGKVFFKKKGMFVALVGATNFFLMYTVPAILIAMKLEKYALIAVNVFWPNVYVGLSLKLNQIMRKKQLKEVIGNDEIFSLYQNKKKKIFMKQNIFKNGKMVGLVQGEDVHFFHILEDTFFNRFLKFFGFSKGMSYQKIKSHYRSSQSLDDEFLESIDSLAVDDYQKAYILLDKILKDGEYEKLSFFDDTLKENYLKRAYRTDLSVEEEHWLRSIYRIDSIPSFLQVIESIPQEIDPVILVELFEQDILEHLASLEEISYAKHRELLYQFNIFKGKILKNNLKGLDKETLSDLKNFFITRIEGETGCETWMDTHRLGITNLFTRFLNI